MPRRCWLSPCSLCLQPHCGAFPQMQNRGTEAAAPLRRVTAGGVSQSRALWLCITVCFYIFLLSITTPNDYVDSFNYAKHIVDHSQGALPATNDPFWDFGH